jgi:hypothetical protein
VALKEENNKQRPIQGSFTPFRMTTQKQIQNPSPFGFVQGQDDDAKAKQKQVPFGDDQQEKQRQDGRNILILF